MLKVRKILEFGLYGLVFLLPIQTRFIIKQAELGGKPWEYGSFSLYLTHLILLGLLVLLVWYLFKQRDELRSKFLKIPVLWWLIAGLDLFIFISIFVAPSSLIAVYKYLIFLLSLGLLVLILEAPFNYVKFTLFFVAGLVFQSLLGIGQFLNQFAPAFKYLGLAEHDPKNLGVAVIETIASDGIGERWLRAYGGLDHPNILGGVLAIGSIIFLTLLAQKYYQNKNKQALGFLILIFLVSGLFFSFSRGAFLAFGVGALVLVVGQALTRQRTQLKATLKALSIATVFLLVLIFSYQDLIKTRVVSENRLEKRSNQERLVSFSQAGEIIKEKPVLGVGLGNYTLALAQREVSTDWDYQPVHNSFLLIAAEIGLIGLLFFLSVLIYLVIKSFELKNVFNLSILTSLVIILMVDHWLFSLPFGVLFFWLIIAVVYKNLKLKNSCIIKPN